MLVHLSEDELNTTQCTVQNRPCRFRSRRHRVFFPSSLCLRLISTSIWNPPFVGTRRTPHRFGLCVRVRMPACVRACVSVFVCGPSRSQRFEGPASLHSTALIIECNFFVCDVRELVPCVSLWFLHPTPECTREHLRQYRTQILNIIVTSDRFNRNSPSLLRSRHRPPYLAVCPLSAPWFSRRISECPSDVETFEPRRVTFRLFLKCAFPSTGGLSATTAKAAVVRCNKNKCRNNGRLLSFDYPSNSLNCRSEDFVQLE